MTFACTFLFHKSLNDFLPVPKKQEWLTYTFHFSASVKDAIEAMGIPHVEVAQLLVNGKPVSFSYLLQPDDRVEVFPFDMAVAEHLTAFVLDVHLGKLARLLRLLGVDAHYETAYTDAEIVAIAVRENRIVLTRDVGLLKHKVLQQGYWLRSQQPEAQLFEVIARFALCETLRPFIRCLSCNGSIHEVDKKIVEAGLLPNTKEFFHEFYRCNRCGKVYWKGSHYENMVRYIERVRSLAC